LTAFAPLSVSVGVQQTVVDRTITTATQASKRVGPMQKCPTP
jgi:hypothetical protein